MWTPSPPMVRSCNAIQFGVARSLRPETSSRTKRRSPSRLVSFGRVTLSTTPKTQRERTPGESEGGAQTPTSVGPKTAGVVLTEWRCEAQPGSTAPAETRPAKYLETRRDIAAQTEDLFGRLNTEPH